MRIITTVMFGRVRSKEEFFKNCLNKKMQSS